MIRYAQTIRYKNDYKKINPLDSAGTLWYNPKVNRFKDESGKIIHDLSPYFNTWQLDKWKKTGCNAIAKDKSGKAWKLFYDEECEHHCLNCLKRCYIYDLIQDY